MKAKDNIFVLIIGLIIAFASIISAINGIHHWYFPAVIGIWLVFDYFSSKNNDNTAWQLLIKKPKEFFKLYVLMFLVGCAIEIIGQFILGLWSYPYYTNPFFYLANILFYPFILFSFREMYESLIILLKNRTLTFISSMILGIVIWEIPNLYSFDWIYTIPYIQFSILKINIIVILGWSILIAAPLWIYKNFFNKK